MNPRKRKASSDSSDASKLFFIIKLILNILVLYVTSLQRYKYKLILHKILRKIESKKSYVSLHSETTLFAA